MRDITVVVIVMKLKQYLICRADKGYTTPAIRRLYHVCDTSVIHHMEKGAACHAIPMSAVGYMERAGDGLVREHCLAFGALLWEQ